MMSFYLVSPWTLIAFLLSKSADGAAIEPSVISGMLHTVFSKTNVDSADNLVKHQLDELKNGA
jgi:hypothetical protein